MSSSGFSSLELVVSSIDCPELNVLVYRETTNASLLKVKHPETIRKLETSMFGPKLAPFKNVECLVTRSGLKRSTEARSCRYLN